MEIRAVEDQRKTSSLWVEMGPRAGREERKALTPTLALLCEGGFSSTVLATEQYALLRAGVCFRANSGRRKKRRTRKHTRLKVSRVPCDDNVLP